MQHSCTAAATDHRLASALDQSYTHDITATRCMQHVRMSARAPPTTSWLCNIGSQVHGCAWRQQAPVAVVSQRLLLLLGAQAVCAGDPQHQVNIRMLQDNQLRAQGAVVSTPGAVVQKARVYAC
jgi:hypothetical protein